MSIKLKLSIIISLIVMVVLSLNISIYYFSTKNELIAGAEQQALVIAKQIGASVELARQSRRLVEDSVGSMLRMAAVSAQEQLPADLDEITNEQLVLLSKRIGVDHITLWERTDDDIIVRRSSDPDELGMSSKSWDYWYTAFNQLFDLKPVSIKQGQKLEHYWSGPYNFATSNPDIVNKWGNYYDGTTNYMINPYINAESLLHFERTIGTDAQLSKMVADNQYVLEITGFDPEFFGEAPILKMKKGVLVHNLDVRGIIFGNYNYINETADFGAIQQSHLSGELTTLKAENEAGHKLLKSFIPVSASDAKPYVIGVTMDHHAIESSLYRQLFNHILISLGLILVTLAASYWISGIFIRPMKQVLTKVNEIAEGNFGAKISLANKKDELGVLATHVNTMSDNLSRYMNQIKESAEELRSTKEYLESFINHTSDAIHVADGQGRLLQANRAFEQIYGWRIEELKNQVLPMPPVHRKEYDELVARVLQGEAIADHETNRQTKQGLQIDVSLTISPIRNSQGNIIAIASISRNITQRKQAEELLRRSEKLSVVGQLAAGVAHEVRNPLQTLKGFVQLNKSKGALSQAHLDVMLEELDRINFIVSEFLVLAKPQIVSIQPVDMAALLDNLSVLLNPEAGMQNIRIVTQFSPDVMKVRGVPDQLKQVFVNLVKNGIEAMPDGGTLAIELEQADNNHVRIRVVDHGRGMSQEQLQRIGEPFFTCKENGTGLGLMVCQQIIANHKGKMTILSKLQEGTTVEILLPGMAPETPPS